MLERVVLAAAGLGAAVCIGVAIAREISRRRYTQDEPPTVVALHVFPVKSCAGMKVQKAQVTRGGFQHDREWMIVKLDSTDPQVSCVPNCRRAFRPPRTVDLRLAPSVPT